jgi:RNA polymerase sigma-70 factor (ECF subfamily)
VSAGSTSVNGSLSASGARLAPIDAAQPAKLATAARCLLPGEGAVRAGRCLVQEITQVKPRPGPRGPRNLLAVICAGATLEPRRDGPPGWIQVSRIGRHPPLAASQAARCWVRVPGKRLPAACPACRRQHHARVREPFAWMRGVTRVTVDQEHGLRELYAASYQRLVSVVGAIGGNRQEAEDAVQDAFVRLVAHWPKVSRYDDPEAWLRMTALRLASNRRRKVLNGSRVLLRLRPEAHVQPPSGAAVDVERALESLPDQQRAVLVLHQLGLNHHEIGVALGIPVGTVKSRLSRARTTLAPLLAEKAI